MQGRSRDTDAENGHAYAEGKGRLKPTGRIALTSTDYLTCKAAS